MPERRRRFLRPCTGLLALALTVLLGDLHVPLALRTPPAYTAVVTAPAGEADPRRERHRDRVRCPRPRPPGREIIPPPRCHYD
ncbi:hypothetical protein [Nocardiopsis halotolerans]|uniref:hypothetical protein n=1 Tax=Nocardiopsis halotolerans TaxID=124252 RepID=UPI000347874D|nr:hypothetical protein [Nocardiopsis halotolerans]